MTGKQVHADGGHLIGGSRAVRNGAIGWVLPPPNHIRDPSYCYITIL